MYVRTPHARGMFGEKSNVKCYGLIKLSFYMNIGREPSNINYARGGPQTYFSRGTELVPGPSQDLELEFWSPEPVAQDLGCGIWDLESGVWGLESGIWDLEPKVWSLTLESGLWALGSGVWSLGAGIWSLRSWVWELNLGSGVWDIGSGLWVLGSWVWGLGSGLRKCNFMTCFHRCVSQKCRFTMCS